MKIINNKSKMFYDESISIDSKPDKYLEIINGDPFGFYVRLYPDPRGLTSSTVLGNFKSSKCAEMFCMFFAKLSESDQLEYSKSDAELKYQEHYDKAMELNKDKGEV